MIFSENRFPLFRIMLLAKLPWRREDENMRRCRRRFCRQLHREAYERANLP